MDTKSKKPPVEEKKQAPLFINPENDARNEIQTKGERIEETEEDTGLGMIKSQGDEVKIPESVLDDADETIGDEDEENNYYMLGGES